MCKYIVEKQKLKKLRDSTERPKIKRLGRKRYRKK